MLGEDASLFERRLHRKIKGFSLDLCQTRVLLVFVIKSYLFVFIFCDKTL